MASTVKIFVRSFKYSPFIKNRGSEMTALDRKQLKWQRLSLFVALPSVIMASIYILIINPEHPEPPEFVPYDFMLIRTKRFPWGDGNHTLFHNPRLNALPDGYEKIDD